MSGAGGANRAAWEAREQLCPEGREKSALHLIVQQFTAEPPTLKGPTSDGGEIMEFSARRVLRECPYDAEAYFQLMRGRIERVRGNGQDWTEQSDLAFVRDCACAVMLLAPKSPLAQDARTTCDRWRHERGYVAEFN